MGDGFRHTDHSRCAGVAEPDDDSMGVLPRLRRVSICWFVFDSYRALRRDRLQLVHALPRLGVGRRYCRNGAWAGFHPTYTIYDRSHRLAQHLPGDRRSFFRHSYLAHPVVPSKPA